MKLLSNTVLHFKENMVNYEILLTGSILLFKPFFYHFGESFPCIILTRDAKGWKLQDHFDKKLEEEIMEDVSVLAIR